MLRALVLIVGFLFFRTLLPRRSRRSPTEISPYMNSLDGLMSAQQVSSTLDETMPFDSWMPNPQHRASRALH